MAGHGSWDLDEAKEKRVPSPVHTQGANMKPGDVVQLTIGGPLMTVNSTRVVDPDGEPFDGVECIWFDGQDHLQREGFRADQLTVREVR